jgi:hypothetical protein
MIRTVGIIALFLFALAGNALAAPVGMVTQMSGKVESKPAAGSAWKTLRLLDRLEVGDNIRCSQGAEAIVVLFDSAERYTVSSGATAVIEAKSVRGASKNSGLRGPAIQVAKTMVGDRPGGFLARPALSHQRMTPQFPGWMPEGERHFDWKPIPNAATYTFTLFDTRQERQIPAGKCLGRRHLPLQRGHREPEEIRAGDGERREPEQRGHHRTDPAGGTLSQLWGAG